MKRREITAFVTEVGQAALDQGRLEISAMEFYMLGGKIVELAGRVGRPLTDEQRRAIALDLCVTITRCLLEKE